MVVNFTKHNAQGSSSSRGVFDYLTKENEERIDEFWERALENEEDISSIDENSIYIEKNLFFNQDYESNEEKYFDEKDASKIIDDNISSNTKKDQSQFFMINISPSKSELDHLKKIAELELERNGIGEKEKEILLQSEQGQKQYKELINDLMHQQLREYTKDVMKDYANNFDREVYANPNNLPTQLEERQISKQAKADLEKMGISKNDKNYGEVFKERKIELAKAIGKDLSTRKLDERDLVWFGKVEEKRTYKDNDKWVMQNRKIYKEIENLDPKNDFQKIENLKASLNRDRATNEIVRAGMKKGGEQYHVHVIVSRYDKCKFKNKKISLSPLANHRNSKIKNNDVGFNRDNFRNKVENSFDQKFKFQRENTYNNYKERKLYLRQNLSEKMQNKVKGQVSSLANKAFKPIKNELKKQTGYSELRNLSLQSTISKELGFRIPLNVPKTPLDAAVKIVRFAVSKIMDASRGY